jgi:hypothetical protein
MKKYIILICTSIFLLTSCNKDTTGAEISLAYQMISDKIWYLDYNQTISSKGTSTKTYIGQSTYFVKFLKNFTTVDSDGINGTYTVVKVNGKLQIQVLAKTAGANSLEYIYDIETLGANNMILYYVSSGSTIKFFYSTSH